MIYDPVADSQYQLRLGPVLEHTASLDTSPSQYPAHGKHDNSLTLVSNQLHTSRYSPGPSISDVSSQSSLTSDDGNSQSSSYSYSSPEDSFDDCLPELGGSRGHLRNNAANSAQGQEAQQLVQLSRVASQPQSKTAAAVRRALRDVPYRPKSSLANQEVSVLGPEKPSGITLDMTVPPTDVQRSRMRSTNNFGPEFSSQNQRRGRSVSSVAGPPHLRRDTDNTDVIVKMIVMFCTHLINSIWKPVNTQGAETTSPQSGSSVLPLQVFITETLRRSKTSYSTLQIALYYLILLKQCLPSFTSASPPGQSGCRAMHCGRRMFLTALILASKYLQDRNYSARAWSKISGLPLKEINENERRFLNIVGWDLHIPKDTFENWSKIVLNVCRRSTYQDLCSKAFDQSPPGPPGPDAGIVAQRQCLLQSMCKDMAPLRNWWLVNLQKLRTEIVRCPKRTQQYIESVVPFNAGSYLSRPVMEPSLEEQYDQSFLNQMTAPLPGNPRQPSLDRVSSCQSTPQIGSPASSNVMPPPPVFKNLPTPQTTPHNDVTGMFTPGSWKPSLRCRASASVLGNLERGCHPLANLDTCPPPKPPSHCHTQRPWSEYQTLSTQQVPERSLTSSPASVVSDVSSFAGRSRSSSISSTSSWANVSMPPKESLNTVQQKLASIRQQCVPRRPVPWAAQDAERPLTAFKVPTQSTGSQSGQDVTRRRFTNDDNFVDEGYGSDDHDKKRREMLQQQDREAAQMLANFSVEGAYRQATTRPKLDRCSTEVFAPRRTEDTNTQFLKRSRSESLDLRQSASVAEDGCGIMSCFIPNDNFSLWTGDLDQQIDNQQTVESKEIQHPTQSWAAPRMPMPSGPLNKRLAVQVAAPFGAPDLASEYLKNEYLQVRLGSTHC